MAKIKIGNDWWTAPAESENGELIIVTGRNGVEPARETGKYINRIEVTWKYAEAGMPSLEDSKLMEAVTESLNKVLNADPIAVMTGIFTGEGERNWVFYTRSMHLFSSKFNTALADLPLIPFTFYADADPDWEAYDEMKQSEILPGDEDS